MHSPGQDHWRAVCGECTCTGSMRATRAVVVAAVLACLCDLARASEKDASGASHTAVIAAGAAVCVVAAAGLAVWGVGCLCCRKKPPPLPTVPKPKRVNGEATKTPDWATERAMFMSPVNRHTKERAAKSELEAKGAVQMVSVAEQ